MSNFFAFSRPAFEQFKDKPSKRLRGPCETIMRYLLLEAQYQEGFFDGLNLKRGQIFRGRYSIENHTGLTEQTIRSSLAEMVKIGEISKKVTNKGTLFTLLFYDTYDAYQNESNQQVTSDQPASNHIQRSSKEIKEIKELKELPPSTTQGEERESETSFWVKMNACWAFMCPGGRIPFPRSFFKKAIAAHSEQIVQDVVGDFIATKGTVDALDRPERWSGYLWAMLDGPKLALASSNGQAQKKESASEKESTSDFAQRMVVEMAEHEKERNERKKKIRAYL